MLLVWAESTIDPQFIPIKLTHTTTVILQAAETSLSLFTVTVPMTQRSHRQNYPGFKEITRNSTYAGPGVAIKKSWSTEIAAASLAAC